jgi:DNA-binding beta-propeller fold protein YncE
MMISAHFASVRSTATVFFSIAAVTGSSSRRRARRFFPSYKAVSIVRGTLLATIGVATLVSLESSSQGQILNANFTKFPLFVAYGIGPGAIRDFGPTGTDLGIFATSTLGLFNPQGVAFDSSGNLYAANRYSNSIEKISPTGIDLGLFVANAGLNSPFGIAFDNGGNLYAANGDGNSVKKFGPTGTDLGIFATAGVDKPRGIAFDASGNLYVSNVTSDFVNGYVEKFSATGADLGRFALVDNPNGLAFDNHGNLYVANYNNNNILKFSPTGTALGIFASSSLSQPNGIAFDSSGNLYVANTLSHTVESFSPTGIDLGAFASAGGSGPGPTYIAFAPVPEPPSLILAVLGFLGCVSLIQEERSPPIPHQK